MIKVGHSRPYSGRKAGAIAVAPPAGEHRLLRAARHIAVVTLIRTVVLACLLALFYAGHKSQPFELNVRRTPPVPHASTAPELMERRAPLSP